MLFKRATNDALQSAGFDPQWITEHDGEGPYAVIRILGKCPCCGGDDFSGWTVVNLETSVGHSQDWHGDNGEVEAHEVASMLNGAWTEGRKMRDAEAVI